MDSAKQDFHVNMGGFDILGVTMKESLPPNSPFASLMNKAGTQTTPPLARGNLNSSAIALLNGNLEHACDFKFMFTIDFSTYGLVDPVSAIQKALQDAKLKATNRLRGYLKDAMQNFRLAIDAVLGALGFDPSGQLSLQFQLGKDIIRKVNDALEWVTEKTTMIMEWVYFAQEIQQLVNWISTLPDTLKKMLQTCLNNFNKSLNQIAKDVRSIPSQIASATTSQVQSLASQFTQAAQTVATAAQTSLTTQSNTMPDALLQVLSDPSTQNTTALSTHITTTTDAAKATVDNTKNQTAIAAKPTNSA